MAIEVKIYEQIRYLTEHEGLSQRKIAEQLRISRKTVKKYFEGRTAPWERKEGSGRSKTVLTDDVCKFVKACLDEDDELNLKKQHHTAKRIYDRLEEEKGFTGGESTIREYVAELKDKPKDVFVPLSYDPAEAIQVDWGEATIFLAGMKTKINFWCMRECYSNDFFCKGFFRQNEESFLEGMRDGFEYFNGVPKKVIFDNAKVAVKEGFGYHAKVTDKYLAMSAHYTFKPVFCNVAQGHEKGLVEGLVGFARRNTMVPIPRVNTLEELNDLLLQKAIKYRQHQVKGKPDTVGEMTKEYQRKLIPLPPFRYDTSNTILVKADDFSLVRFGHNKYSIPFIYASKTVSVKGYGNSVEIFYQNTKISTYYRIYDRNKTEYRLEHYIDLIERRPRSVYNATPIKKTLPAELLDYSMKLDNPKDVIKLLRLYMEHGNRLIDLIEGTTEIAQIEGKLIKVMPKIVTRINEIKVTQTNLGKYDSLLKEGAAV